MEQESPKSDSLARENSALLDLEALEMPNAQADRPQSGGAVGGEGSWGLTNDGGMKALWGPGSSAWLGRRAYDDETEYEARWSNADGWNKADGNDGGSLPPFGAR